MWLQKGLQYRRCDRKTLLPDYVSLHYDPELPACHSGPWWCITIPSLVTFTKGSAVEEILSMGTFNGILNLFCDLNLDHNRVIQSFHKTIQLKTVCHQTKSSCKRISSSEDILQSHILIIWSFTVILALKMVIKSFWKTIWLIMMHHHTKFGTKRSSESEDIIWTYMH